MSRASNLAGFTTAIGVPVNLNVGVITATSFSGSFDASNLTGTVADARISSLTASKLTGALPAINGANITGISTLNIVNYEPGGGGGSYAVDYQEFTSSGTWTKPAGATFIYVEVQGGGGGGASGTRNAVGQNACGGRGGAGAATHFMTFPATSIPSTVSITVGSGGTGAAAQTVDSTLGIAGAGGGQSKFGNFVISLSVNVSNGGQQNTNLTVSQGAVGGNFDHNPGSAFGGYSYAGKAYASSYAIDGQHNSKGGGGGGSGNGVKSDESLGDAGGSGGDGFAVGISTFIDRGTQVGQTLNGGSSTNGIDGLNGSLPGMGGGGGYTASVTERGGNGGNGAFPGGAGGGGAGSRNGYNSGAGGNGASGRVRVYTW